MKYFVFRVKFLKDGTIKKTEVMDYNTRQKAIAKLFSNIATDMADETLQGSVCVVLNEHGGTEKREYWELEDESTPESEA